MKILITAARTLTNADYQNMEKAMQEHYPNATEILHGGAIGGDQLASRYARENDLKETIIKPDYKRYGGKLAPLMRNTELAKLADATLACYAGTEKKGGTANAARHTTKEGKPLIEIDATTGKDLNPPPPQMSLW